VFLCSYKINEGKYLVPLKLYIIVLTNVPKYLVFVKIFSIYRYNKSIFDVLRDLKKDEIKYRVIINIFVLWYKCILYIYININYKEVKFVSL